MPDIPYFKVCEDFCFFSLKPLKPTGKWKIESGPYYENKIFIQHQGLIFKRWISEDDIVFAPAPKKEIFTCGSANED